MSWTGTEDAADQMNTADSVSDKDYLVTDHEVTDHEVTEQDFADDATELPLEILDEDELRGALEAMLLIVDAPAPSDQLAAALADTTERVQRTLREIRPS